jgi:hypothetical protein
MFVRSTALILTAVAALSLSACATRATRLDAQWVNPEFAGKRAVRSVMVMAAIRDSTNRRMFEDRMVTALSGAGVKAVQSYKFIPADGPVREEQLQRAVSEAGAGHAVVSRVTNVSTEVNVTPGMVMGPTWGPGWGSSAAWGPGWRGFAGYYNTMWMTSTPPRVTTTERVHADTRLFDAASAVVVWSGATTTTTNFNSVQQIIDQFADLLVQAMHADGVI